MKGGEKKGKGVAILVVNMTQDDPIARKNISELISRAAKYVGYCYPFYTLFFSFSQFDICYSYDTIHPSISFYTISRFGHTNEFAVLCSPSN